MGITYPPTSFFDGLPRPLPADLSAPKLEPGQTTPSVLGSDSPRAIFLGLDVGGVWNNSLPTPFETVAV